MIPSRRRFLFGAAATLVAAPAIVRVSANPLRPSGEDMETISVELRLKTGESLTNPLYSRERSDELDALSRLHNERCLFTASVGVWAPWVTPGYVRARRIEAVIRQLREENGPNGAFYRAFGCKDNRCDLPWLQRLADSTVIERSA